MTLPLPDPVIPQDQLDRAVEAIQRNFDALGMAFPIQPENMAAGGPWTGPAGPQGPSGAAGAKGDTGDRGSMWHYGTGVPVYDANTQRTADWYVDLATGDAYVLAGTTWHYYFNLKGPVGPAGPPGAGGDLHYIHVQGTVASTWTITHNLGKRPSVTVVDSSGREHLTEVEHLSVNACVVTCSAAFSGQAYVN